MKIELQTLSTGHLAPFADNDIRINNELGGRFPHGPIADHPGFSHLGPGSMVIDCGAFIGDNTLEFVKKGWKVIAFEPFFDSWICARINCPDTDIRNAAVGDGRKAVLNYECPGTNHGMRSMTHSGDGKPTVTIDSLNLDRCDMIKIDVEGFEPFVMDGARKTIEKFRPILFVEANEEALNRYDWTIAKLEKHIISFGYKTEMVGLPPRWDWLCRPE